MNAVTVGKPLIGSLLSLNITEFIQGENPMSVANVGMFFT